MTKRYLNLIMVVLTATFLSFSSSVKANHAAGGELIYQWLSDSTYTFYFKLYRDCRGVSADVNYILCASPSGCTGNASPFNAILQQVPSPVPTGGDNGSQVNVGCPQYKTTCDSPGSTIPGYQEWWYSRVITLPARCIWTFSVSISSRNTSVNIGPGILHVEAMLNNLIAQGNSSPYFSIQPIPYVCINQPENYNSGAIDPDNDSLAFQLIQPLDDNLICPPTTFPDAFNAGSPPYNLTTNPFQTNNTFSINTQTGQIGFTPVLNGAQTITTKAKEYRHGILIGSSSRDIQIQVITCVTAAITPSTPSLLINATYVNGTLVKDCSASSLNFCFYVKASDSSAVLVVTDNHNQIAPGSVLTYSNVNKDSVRGCFSWTPTSADTGTKLLFVTVKDSTCRAPGVSVSQTFTYPLRIYFSTPPTVNSPVNYCQYDTASPLTANGQNLLWYTTDTGGTGSTTAPIPQTDTARTTTWYVSQNPSGNCESDRVPITVKVKAAPLPPGVTDVAYCVGVPTLALTATGTNLKWYTQALGGAGNSTAPVPSSAVAGKFKWYVSQTVGGCESRRDSITVTIIPGTLPPTAPTPVMYCLGDAALPLTATGIGLLWYTTATGGTGSTYPPIPNTNTVGDTYFYVSQTAGSCETPRTAIKVSVFKPIIANLSGLPDSICRNDSIKIDSMANTPSTAVYNWTIDTGTVTGTSPGPFVIKFNKDGFQKIILTIVNGACISTDSATVFIKQAPEASFSVKNDICVDEMVVIDSITAINALYHWTLNAQPVFDTVYRDQYQLSWSAIGVKTLSLTIIGANGCPSLPYTQTITVHKTEAIISNFDKPQYCIGDTIALSTISNSEYIYSWTPDSNFVNSALPDVLVLAKNRQFIYLHVTDKWGCNSADSAFIFANPCCTVTLPDAFTPNGDGKNDKFHLMTIGHHKIITFMIVNRWGQTLFSTGNESDGWDGTFKSTIQDPDTYFYYLRYRCADNRIYEQKGNFILVR